MPDALTDRTDLTIVLDRSGSMESIRAAMEESLDGMLREQRQQPGSMRVTLHRFDDRFETPFESMDLADLKPIRIEPRGGTALLDAMAHAIRLTQQRLDREPADARPRTVVVTITDGMENSSHQTSWDQLNALVQQKQELGWQFLFLGANIDAIATASRMGIRMDRAMNFAAGDAGVRASTQSLGAALCRMRLAAEMSDVVAFPPEDEPDAADAQQPPKPTPPRQPRKP